MCRYLTPTSRPRVYKSFDALSYSQAGSERRLESARRDRFEPSLPRREVFGGVRFTAL
jgi:hypothetical protein